MLLSLSRKYPLPASDNSDGEGEPHLVKGIQDKLLQDQDLTNFWQSVITATVRGWRTINEEGLSGHEVMEYNQGTTPLIYIF